jgi:hypothetical protein
MKMETNNAKVEQSVSAAMGDLRLAAARKRLAECSGQTDAIEALREIVSNLLGSEEMALFHGDCRTADFRTLWSFGIDPEKYNLPETLTEKGLQRMGRGECHVEADAGKHHGSRNARAFVPIRVANDTVAVLAILQLLPQKDSFDRADMDLLTLLSSEAGKALFRPGTPCPDEPGNENE